LPPIMTHEVRAQRDTHGAAVAAKSSSEVLNQPLVHELRRLLDTVEVVDDPSPRVHVKTARAGSSVAHEANVMRECAHPNVIEYYSSSDDGNELSMERGV